MRRVHVIISGRVQGVGFRYYTQQTSGRLGLVGFVRNRSDGTVEVEAEGGNESIEEILTWLRDGPAGARVQDTQVTEMDLQGEPSFDTRS